MSGAITLCSKITGCANKAGSEMLSPDAIHKDASQQARRFLQHGFGKLCTSAALRKSCVWT